MKRRIKKERNITKRDLENLFIELKNEIHLIKNNTNINSNEYKEELKKINEILTNLYGEISHQKAHIENFKDMVEEHKKDLLILKNSIDKALECISDTKSKIAYLDARTGLIGTISGTLGALITFLFKK